MAMNAPQIVRRISTGSGSDMVSSRQSHLSVTMSLPLPVLHRPRVSFRQTFLLQ
jgi:hypothetical protein